MNTSLYILLTWNLLKVNKEFCEGHEPINGLDGGFDFFFFFGFYYFYTKFSCLSFIFLFFSN